MIKKPHSLGFLDTFLSYSLSSCGLNDRCSLPSVQQNFYHVEKIKSAFQMSAYIQIFWRELRRSDGELQRATMQ